MFDVEQAIMDLDMARTEADDSNWVAGYARSALSEIARLRAEREWVSVEGKGYADWGDDAYLVLGDSGRMCEGGWFTDEWWTAEPIGNVTHYMPLPPSPEAK